MSKDVLSSESYKRVAHEATEGGKRSATHKGEQRIKEGKGLHELVDPKSNGLIRRSLNRFEPVDGKLVLSNGIAILIETRYDTTGSMGGNIQMAFDSLPRSYGLVAIGPRAVLGRYDTQIITSMFNDVCDNYVLLRSHAEMNEKIAEQMALMVPERMGGDFPEDPQYGIFASAYLTAADINRYDLKSYDFTVSDAPGRTYITEDTLKRVFGESVFEKVAENGFQFTKKNIPTTAEAAKDLIQRAHTFFLQVEENTETYNYWKSLYGPERIVKLPGGTTKYLPEVEAVIIGLTEGTLTLQTVEEFLTTEDVRGEEFLMVKKTVSKEAAKQIVRAVAGIPIGAQTALPNFAKIPPIGSVFADKRDLWPISTEHENKTAGKGMWK